MVIDGTIAMTMASLTALAVAWRDGRGRTRARWTPW